MAKRNTGPGKPQKTHSHKTKKRLAIKYAMLAKRVVKKRI